MSDNPFAPASTEDLPRTVRQQKEARLRDQMARESHNTARSNYASRTAPPPPTAHGQFDDDFGALAQTPPGEYPLATVARLQLPFFHLMGFFLKAVLAAIPALLVALVMLMGMFWVVGQALERYLPWLIKMRIVISFPG